MLKKLLFKINIFNIRLWTHWCIMGEFILYFIYNSLLFNSCNTSPPKIEELQRGIFLCGECKVCLYLFIYLNEIRWSFFLVKRQPERMTVGSHVTSCCIFDIREGMLSTVLSLFRICLVFLLTCARVYWS